MKRTTLLLSLLITPVLGLVPPALAQADDIRPDEYESGDFGRVRYHENGVTLVRAAYRDSPESRDRATINAPIFPGDSLISDDGQRVEIELAGGDLIHVARRTELTFQSLPDPYAEYSDSVLLRLKYGALQVSAELRENEEFRIDTPHASVYLLGSGEFRVDVEQAHTMVQSRRGVAEVVSEGGSVLLRGGTRTTVYPGSLPGDPVAFNTFGGDGFDRWVEDRLGEEQFRDRYAYEQDVEPYDELPSEVRPYYRELSRHGRWVWVDDYGYCWYPYDVGAGWRPYYDGYWDYGPRGYFWVSYEPWGWAPYHYGRWNWVRGYGWCWIPGRVFAGAWVSWSWGSAYVGWSPLGYWNRPAYVHHYYHGYYDPYAWTFINYRHFHHRHYPRYVVSYDHVRDHVRGTAVVTRPPRVSPRELAENPDARARVARRTREDTRAHLPRIVDGAKPGPRFSDAEDRLVRRGRAKARPVAGNPDDPTRARGPVRTPRAGRPTTAPRAGEGIGSRAAPVRPRATIAPRSRVDDRRAAPQADADRTARPGRDNTGSVPRRAVTRQPTRGPRRDADTRTVERDRARTSRTQPSRPSQVTPRRSGSRDTGARVRELYRRSAEPRKPRPSRPSAGSSSSRDKPKQPSARPSGSRSGSKRPSARPSGSGSGSKRPSARSSGSRGPSRPSARSSGSRGPSRPSARSSGSRGPSRPSARSSGSSRSKPSSQRGSSRSGGGSKGKAQRKK